LLCGGSLVLHAPLVRAGETQITSDPATDQRPAWSPDDSTFVFDSDRSGNPDLWLVPSAGGAATQLTTNYLLDRHGDWSSDGTTIAYSGRESGGILNPDIWTIPSGGGSPTKLDSDTLTTDRFPAYSPSGTQIAYTKDGDIYLIPSGGGTPVQLTTNAATDQHPTWSPDGSTIAFVSDRSGNLDIWTIPASGGTATQVTTHGGNDSAPDWSPAGDRIAFHTDRNGNNDLYLISATGGTAIQVTSGSVADSQPDWANGGARIAFNRDGNIWIYTFPVDLSLVKTVSDPAPSQGATITYTIALSNAGPDSATGVAVTDVLPAGVTYQSASATQGTYSAGTGVWTVGAMAASDADTLTITVTVDVGTTGTTITNTASVTAVDQLDPDSTNDSDGADISVQAILAITSSANQIFVVAGPTTAISPIRIVDDGTSPTVTAANDLRVRIPSGFNMDWDTADVTATIGGIAAAKVSGTVTYEDAGKTLVLEVTSDFAAADQITVSDLSFTNFTAPSGPSSLELEVNNDGAVSATDDKTIEVLAPNAVLEGDLGPESFALGAARPNPFHESTMIEFTVPVAGSVELTIFDITGRRVRFLVRSEVQPGVHRLVWDGRDQDLRRVSAGVYFVRLESGSFEATQKLIRVR
jgi:TolB protein